MTSQDQAKWCIHMNKATEVILKSNDKSINGHYDTMFCPICGTPKPGEAMSEHVKCRICGTTLNEDGTCNKCQI